MTRLRFLWRRRPVVLVAFVLATLAATLFLGRALLATIYWSAHQQMPVAGWMTPAYVERSWHLPKFALRAPLDLKPPASGEHPQTLGDLARSRDMPEAEMVAHVQKLVEAASRQAPPP
jgi:hypothetical protein